MREGVLLVITIVQGSYSYPSNDTYGSINDRIRILPSLLGHIQDCIRIFPNLLGYIQDRIRTLPSHQTRTTEVFIAIPSSRHCSS